MTDELKKKLVSELNKYSGILTKSDVRPFAVAALNQLNSADFSIPIKNSESPVIQAINAIIQSKNYKNQSELFIALLCDLVTHGFFGLNGINEALMILETHTLQSSQLIGLKIIQFSANILPYIYKDSPALFSTFSIILKMLNHRIPLIQTTAFATLQQMISSLFDLIMKNDGELPKKAVKTLSIFSTEEFTRPLNKITYALLSELRNILTDMPTQCIRVGDLSPTKIISLFNIIISSHSKYLQTEKQFLDIIESSIQFPMPSREFITIYLTFIVNYLELLPQTVTAIFSHFLSELSSDTQSTNALLFFRAVYTSSPDFSAKFIKYCDPKYSLSSALIEQIAKLSKKLKTNNSIEIFINRIPEFAKYATQLPQNYECIAPVEIACLLTFMPHDFILDNYNELFYVLLVGFTMSSIESTPSIIDSFMNLMIALRTCEKRQELKEMNQILSDIVANCSIESEISTISSLKESYILFKEDKAFKSKRTLINSLFIKLFESNSPIIEDSYESVFRSFSSYPEIGIKTASTHNLSTDKVVEIVKYLTVENKFYIQLLTSVYKSNIDRFNDIWNSAVLKFTSNPELTPQISNLIIVTFGSDFSLLKSQICSEFLDATFTEENETFRTQILEGLSSKLQSPPIPDDKAWPYIIKSFSPVAGSSHETVNAAFSGFSFIVKNMLKNVPNTELPSIVSTNFAFVRVFEEINISLSALANLWEIMPRINNNYDMWNDVLSASFEFLTDKRHDVGTAAVNIVFSLISSNEESLPNSVFHHLLTECIIKSLEKISSFKEIPEPTISQFFVNVGHTAIAFWKRFDDHPDFIPKFWPIVFEKIELFGRECEDDQLIIEALQLFTEVFSCNNVNAKMRFEASKVYLRIVEFFIDNFDAKSLRIQVFGRQFAKNLQLDKNYLTVDNCKPWLSTIKRACINLQSQKTTAQSLNKILDCIGQLPPIGSEILMLIADVLTQSLQETPYSVVKESIVDSLVKLASDLDDVEISFFTRRVSVLFAIPYGGKLVDFLVSRAPILTYDETEVFFSVLASAQFGDVIDRNNYLLKLFHDVSTDRQLEFVKVADVKSLLVIWQRFCDPSSNEFNEKMSHNIFDSVMKSIINNFDYTLKDEDSAVDLLKFINEHSVVPKKVGQNEKFTSWHIACLVPRLVSLLKDNRKNVAKLSNDILKKINNDLKIVIGTQ